MSAKHLNIEEFKDKIFDYTNNEEWNFKGDKPVLIDFYAEWCGPCKMIAPTVDELAEEYDGKVDIYKVNTEVEQELSAMFGIRSIPSLLFIPKEGTPKMQKGALQKNDFVKAFEAEFGV
ncbi:thioredoxin [Flammeovirga yaeyamensis]|uniref:Thioredoxin n=1 Tax=Flammeovirga yaeyamensis TaxID=367791 RepID=A0AAX1NE23_9BACT|nr:thioredoxin [Flammeovirga yaeyamensis]MBB3696740.1 thioredoxin [Flammeovirga yaeyamensis]NMF33410.1 thioredoxin [Flammeovirga yaeyamensis]QWG05316.1 thioredoxin [Flammeovirga yaeyamensis]